METYSKEFLNHFLNPRNVGEIPNPDIVGIAEKQERGGKVVFYIKLKKDKIVEIKYKVLGCPAAISASSIISEKCLNQTIFNVKKISDENLKEWLGDMPEEIFECAKLALQALHNGISIYLKERR